MSVPRQDNSAKNPEPSVGTGRRQPEAPDPRRDRRRRQAADGVGHHADGRRRPRKRRWCRAPPRTATSRRRSRCCSRSRSTSTSTTSRRWWAVRSRRGRTPPQRTVEVISLLNQRVLADEVRYRDRCCACTSTSGSPARRAATTRPSSATVAVTGGSPNRWRRSATMSMTPRWSRLVAGLSVLIGDEAMFVLRDVCRSRRRRGVGGGRLGRPRPRSRPRLAGVDLAITDR